MIKWSGRLFKKITLQSDQLEHDRMATLAVLIIFFQVFIAVAAGLISSPYPFLVWDNQTGQQIPVSPYLSSFDDKNRVALDNMPFREWSKQNKISAIFPLVPYSPYEKNLSHRLQGPDFGRFGNYMGTDDLGRDVAARMIHGAGNSMLVGLVAVGISLVFGIIIGALAGFFGGWVDIALSRFIEIVICFPTLIMIMAVIALLKPSLFNIMIVIGITGWTGVARVIRGEVLKRKQQDYVLAARLSGASAFRLLAIHILPNSMAPVVVMAAFGIASAVLVESTLSFLGIGIQPPEPSWGQILNTSQGYLDFAWWMTFYPGFFIFLTVVAFNLAGDRIRKMLNPRERKV